MRPLVFYKNFNIILLILSILYFTSLSHALKCYKCNSLEGFKDFDPDCFKSPKKGKSPMESGADACLSSVVQYMGKPVVVRFGLHRTGLTNDLFVCGRANATIKIGTQPINSYTTCDICDHKDGCNGVNQSVSNPILFVFGLFLCSYFFR